MKKMYFLCLCVVACLCLMCFVAPAAEAAAYGDLTYAVSAGEVTITACSTAATGDLVIPSAIDGYPVTAIGEKAFYHCTGLTSVTIGDGVTTIGNYAFSGCSALKKITMPNSAKTIGNSVFSNCSVLAEVAIPDGVTSVGANAFYKCKKITAIIIPDSVTSLGASAFEQCTGLKTVTIGNGVASIGEKAFYSCKNITAVTVGNGVTSVGKSAFYECTSLTRVEIRDVASWCGISFGDMYANPLYYAKKIYLNGQLIKELTIPNTAIKIGAYAFLNCTDLTAVFIPDSVNSIGTDAFSGCSSLERMTIPFVGESRKTADDTYQYPFGYIFGSSRYTGGTSTGQRYYGSSTASTTAGTYVIPASLKSVTVTGGEILYGAFYNCSGITDITISDTTTAIGDYAFYQCTGLKAAPIGKNVTTIGDYAFCQCTGLTELVIPDSVTTVGDRAFYDCRGLRNVTIGAGVTKLEEGFSVCTNLVGIWVDPENANYSSDIYGILYNKEKTQLITVPRKLTGSCVLPDGLLAIDGTTFLGCTEVTSVKIPDSVTYIQMDSFMNCTSLTEVIIGNGVTDISYATFGGCTALETITIPDNVKRIGDSAFNGCRGLTSIFLGSGLTSIEGGAFYGCDNLQSVYYNGTQAQWDMIQIGDYNTALENAKMYFNGHAHVFTNYVSNNDATYLADGTKTGKCDVCGATDTIIDEGSRLIPDSGMILLQPVAVDAASGEMVSFFVTVYGEVVSYKWQYRKTSKWFDTAMFGYNSHTLTVPAVGSRNGYDYRCIITFADGTQLISDPAKLTVNTVIYDVKNPNTQTVALGGRGQFTASAVGEGLKYQWEFKRPDGQEWSETAMEGATRQTVYVEAATDRDGYAYRCRITDVTGKVVYTEPAVLRVLNFVSQPEDAFASVGNKVQFTVTTTVADGYRYQWQYRRSATGTWMNTCMPGYNTATLTVEATKARDGYEYRCVLTGSKATRIESETAVLHVSDGQTKSLIVNGHSLAAASHMLFTSDGAMVPLVEVLEVLGAEIQWVNNYTAKIVFKDVEYSLNTEAGVLMKEENQANCLIPAPGSSVHYQVVDGVFILDHITMKTVLMIMGAVADVDVDYENNTVVITA